MNQTWKNGKKTFWARNRFNWPKFGSPDFFLWVLPQAIIVCNFKEKVLDLIWPVWPNFDQLFFSKIWLCQPLDIMVSYRHVRYQKK